MAEKTRTLGLRKLREMLAGGDRRSNGPANEVAARLLKGRCDCADVVALLFDLDPVIRMRAADALEKASAANAQLLARFHPELVGLLCRAEQKELRWHLALMAPRLGLRGPDRRRVAAALRRYLEDQSSIVRACALDALAQVATGDPSMQSEVRELLHEAERCGTPAMRARARKLLRARKLHGPNA